MDITPLIKQGQNIIQSYAGGVFKVSGQTFQSAIIVTPSSIELWKANKTVSELSEGDFAPLIAMMRDIDVVLLGCGKTMEFLRPLLKSSLRNKGLSIDVMDTGAACRTYNVLMAEGRRVAAALLPV